VLSYECRSSSASNPFYGDYRCTFLFARFRARSGREWWVRREGFARVGESSRGSQGSRKMMSRRKSVIGSLRGLLRRCASCLFERKAPQFRFIAGNNISTRGADLRARCAVASLPLASSSFNLYAMHQRQPPQLLPLILLLPFLLTVDRGGRYSAHSPTRAPLLGVGSDRPVCLHAILITGPSRANDTIPSPAYRKPIQHSVH